MPPHDLDLWRQRLQNGRRIAKKKLFDPESPMRELIEFYRSNQWQRVSTWKGLPAADLRVVNKILPYANQQQSAIAHTNPRVQYFARSKDSQEKVPAVTALHNYDIHEQNHIRQLNAAFRDHQFAYAGCIRHGYTPEDEVDVMKGEGKNRRVHRLDLYRPANKNRPWIRRVAPWNVIPDPSCEAFHMDGGMRWVAFRDVMTLQQIRDNPNMVARDKLGDIAGHIDPDYMKLRDPLLSSSEDPDANTWLEVWTVYEAISRTWFQMTLDDGIETYLRKPDDWPIPWEWLPVNFFCVNEQIDTPYALSLLEDMLPLQEELNQVRTMLHQGVLRGRRINFAAKAAFEDEDMERLADADMNEWFAVKGVDAKNATHSINSGALDPGTLQHLAIVQEDLRESGGLSKMGRGQRINVESASEAAFVQRGQDEAEARIEDCFTGFTREVEDLYMQGRRYIMAQVGDTESVRILGSQSNELAGFATVDAEQLHGLFEFEVVAGSMRRRDIELEARQALADYQVAAAAPAIFNQAYFARIYVTKRGHAPDEAMMPDALEQSRLAAEAQMAGSFAAGQMPTEAGAAGATPSLDPAVVDLLSRTRGMQ